jgi:HlyD family secretion protein
LRLRNAPRFRAAEVSRGSVESVVNSTGTVKAVRSVSVGSFASGPIKEIYVDFNSVVKKDQLLAEIDPALMQANVDRDEAALATQKAEKMRIEALLQQSRNNEERAKSFRPSIRTISRTSRWTSTTSRGRRRKRNSIWRKRRSRKLRPA